MVHKNACIFISLCFVCHILEAAAKPDKIRDTIAQKTMWHKSSSFSDFAFLQAIERDAAYIPYTLDSFSLKQHREWLFPLARKYHLIAQKFGIDNWAGGGYIWFASGGKEEYQAGRQGKTNVYKIHLMPRDSSLVDFALLLTRLINGDSRLHDRIQFYKFIILHDKTLPEMPRVVIYADGKQHAQEVLNRLYEKLQNLPGSGKAARFSAFVTPLIWVAQGDGDAKRDPRYQKNFEQPYLIYYRKDYTGEDIDYHLKHPITGHDLVTPHPLADR